MSEETETIDDLKSRLRIAWELMVARDATIAAQAAEIKALRVAAQTAVFCNAMDCSDCRDSLKAALAKPQADAGSGER